MRSAVLVFLAVAAVACSGGDPERPNESDAAIADASVGDAPITDATSDARLVDAADAHDAGPECWSPQGAPGVCLSSAACNAIADRTPEPAGTHCPGAEIECCIDTPDVADNPPTPAGYKLMMQSQVTPEMTTWAVAILHDPVTYPMFSTVTKTFDASMVLALVEWHPPDFQNNVVHRGVTLYEPI